MKFERGKKSGVGSGSDEYLYCFGVVGPPPTIDSIIIEDGEHTELSIVYLNIGESVTIYAAGYNSSTSSFVRYLEVEWNESAGRGF